MRILLDNSVKIEKPLSAKKALEECQSLLQVDDVLLDDDQEFYEWFKNSNTIPLYSRVEISLPENEVIQLKNKLIPNVGALCDYIVQYKGWKSCQISMRQVIEKDAKRTYTYHYDLPDKEIIHS